MGISGGDRRSGAWGRPIGEVLTRDSTSGEAESVRGVVKNQEPESEEQMGNRPEKILEKTLATKSTETLWYGGPSPWGSSQKIDAEGRVTKGCGIYRGAGRVVTDLDLSASILDCGEKPDQCAESKNLGT